jgi:hypothetical protein
MLIEYYMYGKRQLINTKYIVGLTTDIKGVSHFDMLNGEKIYPPKYVINNIVKLLDSDAGIVKIEDEDND